MIDIKLIIDELDDARSGLNDSRNAAEEWRNGKVAGVDLTAEQKSALKTTFKKGIQTCKDGLVAIDMELSN